MRLGAKSGWFACLLAGVVLGVSACGSDDNGSDTAATGGTAGAEASAETTGGVDLEHVDSQLEKFSGQPAWEAPGPEFDATKAAGKSVFNIPTVSANAFIQAFTDAEAEVAKMADLKFTICDNNGSVSEWAKCATQGVGQNPDVLLLAAADPATLGPQIKAANNADIPVVSAALYDPSTSKVPGVAAWAFEPYEQGARLMADWVIKETDGEANVLIVTANELSPSKVMTKGMADEFATHCGDSCKTTEINVPLPDWATKMQGAIQSALVKDPTINYVIPIYDPMVPLAVAAINAAGRGSDLPLTSFNGTEAALKQIQEGDIVSMIVGQDLRCIGYSNMDPVLRILSDVDPVDNTNQGLRVWSDENIAEAGTPPNQVDGYGDACTSGFEQLWGLN